MNHLTGKSSKRTSWGLIFPDTGALAVNFHWLSHFVHESSAAFIISQRESFAGNDWAD
jgi:hypothetical protein